MAQMTRRIVMEAGLAGAAALTLPGCGPSDRASASAGRPAPASGDPLPAGLAQVAANAADVDLPGLRVEGRLPAGLRGVLYRNGPGMFERAGLRKASLLDGDGFVQRLELGEGRAAYRGRFVRTPKFEREERAGRFVHPTWTTRAPGGPLANLGADKIPSQAGVTVYEVGGRILALDEAAPLYELDPVTLATTGAVEPGTPGAVVSNKAHAKRDPETGGWVFAGSRYGREHRIHTIERGADGSLLSHRVVAAAPSVYYHDFFITRTKIVFLFHPAAFQPLPFLAGLRSFKDSLVWRPEQGTRLLIVAREGDPDPVRLDGPPVWMWHALNAFERSDGRIVLDFVGYDAPDHFLGPDAQLTAFMQGRAGRAEHPGTVRRWTLDPARGGVEEAVVAGGMHEFPIVDARLVGREHRLGYFAAGAGGLVTTGAARIDMETGRRQDYDHGPDTLAGEPVFVRDPEAPSSEERGWLIQQVHDGAAGATFFAVLAAEAVEDGPLAKVWLDRPAPLSFHGWWTGTPA